MRILLTLTIFLQALAFAAPVEFVGPVEFSKDAFDDTEVTTISTTAAGTTLSSHGSWTFSPPLSGSSLASRFSDALFAVFDDVDNTKGMEFQVSGVSAGTTATLTIPDADGTIALTSDLHDAVTLDTDLGNNLLGISTQQLTLDSQTGNSVFASPSGGGAGSPSFRSLIEADLPTITQLGTITAGVWQGTVIDHAYLDTNVVLDDGTRDITGDQNITGSLDVDNLNLNGNTISSTDVNGPLVLDPNGTGNVGIGTNTPATALTVDAAANPEIRIREGSATGSYSSLIDTTAGVFDIQKTAASGTARIRFDPKPSDGTGQADFEFFRNTNTSGNRVITFMRGDGTATADHRFRMGNSGTVAELGLNGGDIDFGGGAGSGGVTITAAGAATFDGLITGEVGSTFGDGTDTSTRITFDHSSNDMFFDSKPANDEIEVEGFMVGKWTTGPTPTGGFILNADSYPTSSASAGHDGLVIFDAPNDFVYVYDDFGTGLEWQRAPLTFSTF